MKISIVVAALVGASCANTEELEKKVADLQTELATTRKDLDERMDEIQTQTAQAKYLERKLDELSREQDQLKRQIATRPSLGQRPPRPEPDRSKTYAIPIDGLPSVGPADAKVTIVKGTEYACPYCEKNRATLDELRQKYGNDLRIVFKPLVVHPTTATASSLAACAAHKQHKFKQMDEALWEKGFKARQFDKQDMVSGKCWLGADGCPIVEGFAKSIGLDMKKFRADMKACELALQSDMRDFQVLGVAATPTFFINGRYLTGAMPADTFSALIDEELAKANVRIQAGTPRARYYEEWVLLKGLKTLDP